MLKSLFFLISFFFIYHGITNSQITNGCDTESKTCYQFSDCTETSNPSDGNIATIYATGDNTVQFQLQYVDASIGWIAIGFSDTRSMMDSYIFMCQQEGSSFTIQERFAFERARPPVSGAQLLTAVSYTNAGGILNCTFTSPVTRTPMLNAANGYWLLLARGQYNNGNIQNHGTSGRCVSATRPVITTAAGVSGSTTIIPAVRFIYAMLALLFASYAFL